MHLTIIFIFMVFIGLLLVNLINIVIPYAVTLSHPLFLGYLTINLLTIKTWEGCRAVYATDFLVQFNSQSPDSV